ncbi:MAG: P-loop NTPase [Terricaulis sp.]
MSASTASASQQSPMPRARPAPIFAVASGKGGVGKTWLSTMLACAFGRAGMRSLLVDCDLGLANIDVQLGVRRKRTCIRSCAAFWSSTRR